MEYMHERTGNNGTGFHAKYSQLQEKVTKLSNVMSSTQIMAESSIKKLNRTCSIFTGNFTKIMNKIPMLESKLISVKTENSNLSKIIQSFASKYSCDTSDIPENNDSDINDIMNISLHTNGGNPFISVGKDFLVLLISQPFLIDMNPNFSHAAALRKYARQCNFTIDFRSLRKPTQEWSIKAILTWKGSDHIIADEMGTELYTIKESMAKNLIMHLSKICNVIAKKKFEDLKCNPVCLNCTSSKNVQVGPEVNTETINVKSLTENTSPDESKEIKSEEEIGSHLINPTAKSYENSANTITVNIFMIRQELIDIFDKFILSADLFDLIFLPEISFTTQAKIKCLVRREYKPWLEPISFKYENLSFLVIRKVVNLKKLSSILESKGDEVGPYKLLNRGDLNEADIPISSAEPSKLEAESEEEWYNDGNYVNSGSINPENVLDGFTLPLKNEQLLSQLPRHENQVDYEFTPSIDDNTELPQNLSELNFIQDYSIVLEDVPHNEYQAVLKNFSNDYRKISFNVKVEKFIDDNSDVPEWIGSVDIIAEAKQYPIATAKSNNKHYAIDEASKKALVILSRMCNIIIRKTGRIQRDKHLYLDIIGTGQKRRGGRPRYPDRREAARVHRSNKAFRKVARVLIKYLKKDSVDDLVFSPGISSATRSFISGLVKGKKFCNKLKIINFVKCGQSYLTVMKVIHPVGLTAILKKQGGENGQYKLYAPRTLNLMAVWNRARMLDAIMEENPMIDDFINESNITYQNDPPSSPQAGQHSNKRNYEDIMDDFDDGPSEVKRNRHDKGFNGKCYDDDDDDDDDDVLEDIKYEDVNDSEW